MAEYHIDHILNDIDEILDNPILESINSITNELDMNRPVTQRFNDLYDDKYVIGNTLLTWASHHNLKETVRLLLDRDANPNGKNIYGDTAIMMASQCSHNDIVQILLDYGANVNSKNNYRATALMWTSKDDNCNPDRWDGIVPLHKKNETVKILLENGANPNRKNMDNNTALMFASSNEYMVIVNMLLEYGANPYMKNRRGESAITWAQNLPNIRNILTRHMNAINMQSKLRGKLTRKKIKTQKAKQKLQATKLPLDYEIMSNIMDNIDQKKYNPSITDRMNLEKARSRLAVASGLHPRLGTNTPIADDLIEKITTNLTGRGKHGKKLSSKKRNKKSKKKKTKKSK